MYQTIFKQIPTNDVTYDDTMHFRFMSEIWITDRATEFTIVPSYHRVWVDGAKTMTRRTMAVTRWYDRAMAMVR